ncbi:peptidyl-prolyl cis-trans isomerase FKBP11 isoform X2 [Piliocolobus tephrosceles]|uniref:peptidyl-prolyl cis-trans isomerase FKBP11 isoform X2 n=1 Tax=Piliocolobus tephrosceles TaxID=591936 RepID=UPI000C29A5F0|nr:peptidyl-prolyl cis-trans isomerase FKBP11 isoform X2 [Piliocolobus tephrosceles]
MWRGERRCSSVPLFPPCFSASSYLARRSAGWRNLREAPALWGFLFLTAGSLVDGRIIDTSLTRDPLVIELGQKQVIPGLEQSLLDMCVGSRGFCWRSFSWTEAAGLPLLPLAVTDIPSLREKRRAIIPSHLAYGKRGFPPSVPADAVVQYDVELIALIRANYWLKLVKGILPLVGMAMVPALLGLIGYHLYRKANRPKVSKKKLKEEKRNKSKKK